MEPRRFTNILIAEGATVRDAIEAIDAGAVEIALAVGDDRRLLGTVSDGDVRRALLRGTQLDDPVAPIIHREPITATQGARPDLLLRLMAEHSIEQIPLLDADEHAVDVASIRELVARPSDTPAVIMAGGQGLRLRPLTDEMPKPMLPVGGRPLLETIVEQVRDAGFEKLFVAVNYRADVIEEHFGDGRRHGVDIEYVREDQQLGSAGALRLMRGKLDRPFLVMNADLLTRVNLSSLMRFHEQEGNLVTVGVRQYQLQVPYGVVEVTGTEVTALREKPSLSFFVNAGIYAASPEAVSLLPSDRDEVHMTDVVDAALAAGRRVGSFPVREFWLDIGQLSDYERAHGDHETHFVLP
jgi:dTDP-glucose pyrophosphorylase